VSNILDELFNETFGVTYNMSFTSEEKKEKKKIENVGDELNRLDEGLKERLDSMSKEELKAFLGQVTLNEMENQKQKKEDQDLAEKKAAAKAAGEKYKEVSKANKTKTEYVKYLLEGQGVTGESETTVND
jgi:membrane protein involved in colicin uptake